MTRPHQIRPSGVRAWLADSRVKRVTIHVTTPEAAREIVVYGAQIAYSGPSAAWGRGFYSALRADSQYGTANVRVAVRLRNPLVVAARDSVRLRDELDAEVAREDVADLRELLLRRGFDGVVVLWEARDAWVVAYGDEQVRVIVTEGQDGD